MTMPDSHTNRRRASLLLLAHLDDDPATQVAILDEAYADAAEQGLAGIIAALTYALGELLVGTTGLDEARATVNQTLLDLSLDEGGSDA